MKNLQMTIAKGKRRTVGLPSPAIRRYLRAKAGLTQQDIADLVGVSRPAINRYERGAREPRGRVRDDYQDLLDCLSRAITS